MPVVTRDVKSLAKSGSAKLKGDVTLTGGSNITLTQSGQDITIAAAGLSDGDKGDVTVSSSGAAWTIDNDVVTFAKMQNVSTNKLLGRASPSTGDLEEITLGTNLSFSGTTLNVASTSPGGSNTQVQFNDGGSFGGDSGLTYDKSTNTLSVNSGGLNINASAFSGVTLTGAQWPGFNLHSSSTSEGTYMDFFSADTTKKGGFVLNDSANGGGAGLFFKSYNSSFDIIFGYEPSGLSFVMLLDVDAGNVGIGTGAGTPSARLHLISTGEQLRVGYDTSNYYSATVGSTGGVTFNAVGSGAGFTFSDGVTFSEHITIADAKNIVLNSTTGTKIGTATTQKLGFFNATPVVQPSAYTTSNVTTDKTYDANSTTVDELADVLGTLIGDLKSLGLIG